ncbi:exonuclease 3'-5' domain-containing protein 2-like [Armigeres subalbatus]|uniref:exonuclease 3'-5' domain-containing protein 2-like n=1 Tax=Armigeres subalbatus TaxID=124917 RepID=UPI002ED1799F
MIFVVFLAISACTIMGIALRALFSKPKAPRRDCPHPIVRLERPNPVITDDIWHVMNNRVHIITTASKFVEEFQKIKAISLKRSDLIVGLDCEWVAYGASRNKVALLQLAFTAGACLLVRLFLMHTIPRELKNILADPRILKVGVDVCLDGHKLLHDYGLTVKGTVDLRHLARKLWIPGPIGLAGLAKTMLDVHLDKNWQICASDWERSELSEVQIHYGAMDAIVALKLFQRFQMYITESEVRLYEDVPFRPNS